MFAPIEAHKLNGHKSLFCTKAKTMKKHIFLWIILGSCLTGVQAESLFPAWRNTAAQFPAVTYTGAHAKPKFTAQTRPYRKLFHLMRKGSINYAGEYVLEFANCGSACSMGLIYNARTGATQLLPSGPISSCTDHPNLMPLAETRKEANSRWLQIVATTNHADGPNSPACYTKTFMAERGKIRLIHQQRLH